MKLLAYSVLFLSAQLFAGAGGAAETQARPGAAAGSAIQAQLRRSSGGVPTRYCGAISRPCRF